MTTETRAAAAAEKEAERVAQARARIAERDEKAAKVREQLDKVAAHPRLGKKVVKEILDKHGKGKKLPEPGVESVHDMKAKQFDDVSERCKEILLEQPSAEDEELIKKIDKAALAEDKALGALEDAGVELGKLLIDAFHIHDSEKKFRAFLKLTRAGADDTEHARPLTIKRAMECMFAAGGKTEGDELKRQLERGARNTRISRDRNRPAITEAPVTAQPAQSRITGNSPVDGDGSDRIRQWAAGDEPQTEPAEKPTEAPKIVPELDLPERPETLEDFLDRMVKAEKSSLPAYAVCMKCIEHLAAKMNAGTRAQLRKDVTALTNTMDKSERKAA